MHHGIAKISQFWHKPFGVGDLVLKYLKKTKTTFKVETKKIYKIYETSYKSQIKLYTTDQSICFEAIERVDVADTKLFDDCCNFLQFQGVH
jgi:hypothetical protein